MNQYPASDLAAATGAQRGCGPIRPSADSTSVPLRQQVFEAVRSAGAIPRVDLAKALAVSPASVTAIVADLIEGGLLHESEAPARGASRGRPKVNLSVDPAAGRVAGLKLSDHVHTGVIVDFAGEPIAHASLPRRKQRWDTESLMAEAETLYDELLSSAGLKRTDISAIGLGIPGIVDQQTGIAHWSPIVSDENIPLRQIVSDRFGVPAQIDNDANLVTLAELWFGAGRSLSDFAVVTIEHGIGMGLVVNHRLYRGGNSLGMELGHTKVQLDGALCRCGQRGCLEAYVADYALVREASTALDWRNNDASQILLQSLFDQAKAGNEAARSIFRRAGRYLAVGLANVINLFDPSLIILSGERMQYDYLYAEEMLAEMRGLIINPARSRTKVEINAWGDLVWARGAAALAMSELTAELTQRDEAVL